MDKKINFILLIGAIAVLITVFYPTNQEQPKTIQEEIVIKDRLPIQEEEVLNISYKEPIDIKKEVAKKEVIIQKVQEVKKQIIDEQNNSIKNIHIADLTDLYDPQLKEETIILASSRDKNGKYEISLKNSQKITSILPGGKYILLNGTLNANGEKSKFSLSFNQHYKDYTQYSYLEIINKTSKITVSCDGSFLSALTPEYRYNLQCDLYGEMLSCYIENEEEDIYIKDNSLAKDLQISDKDLSLIETESLQINPTQGVTNGNSN